MLSILILFLYAMVKRKRPFGMSKNGWRRMKWHQGKMGAGELPIAGRSIYRSSAAARADGQGPSRPDTSTAYATAPAWYLQQLVPARAEFCGH